MDPLISTLSKTHHFIYPSLTINRRVELLQRTIQIYLTKVCGWRQYLGTVRSLMLRNWVSCNIRFLTMVNDVLDHTSETSKLISVDVFKHHQDMIFYTQDIKWWLWSKDHLHNCKYKKPIDIMSQSRTLVWFMTARSYKSSSNKLDCIVSDLYGLIIKSSQGEVIWCKGCVMRPVYNSMCFIMNDPQSFSLHIHQNMGNEAGING
ncbi:hypothetical protein CFOL_v3_20144 [Cephalotus follicularis]|uniref:Uncharacterized protein n=1 Tax=Cephalotus follicularis TaxID=3775 RepID=A0A1Q3C985_CEPFO|nr:hypothetical protein CFOL_v3_20144 [Cephalotus follicularis]